MDQEAPLEVLVLDDISRFAGHVWQCISGDIGFGIGEMSADGKNREHRASLEEGLPLETPSGRARVRWLDAGAMKWESKLSSTLEAVQGKPACFIVDVRGPIRSSFNNYTWESATNILLAGRREEREIFLVSSYLTGTRRIEYQGGKKEFKIHPKTADFLQEIARLLAPSTRDLEGVHILVTGAGFEMTGDQAGWHGFGMPATDEILKRCWNHCGNSVDSKHGSFPIPSGLLGPLEALHLAACEKNLDEYWNEALKLVLENAVMVRRRGRPSNSKVAASQKEYEIREAFRHALLGHDWGHMNQALDAAALAWTAWISTNYTSFADRALELNRLYNHDSERGWSIISSSNQALYLIRKLLHGRHDMPILFKLHGHIDELLTMAVAGQDKEIYSTLSLPVDSLHQIYNASELYLKRRFLSKNGPVLWHIVGHGLKDALLVEMLIRICLDSPKREHKFLFVKPDALDTREHDRRCFRVLALPESRFASAPLTARKYLARLRRFGFSTEDLQDVAGFVKRITSG